MKNEETKTELNPDDACESPVVFPKIEDEFTKADPLKRREPEPNKPGERLQDYLG